MELVVNGEPVHVDAECLNEVLAALGYRQQKVAVAVNNTFVANTEWTTHRVQPGDRLDVLGAIIGG